MDIVALQFAKLAGIKKNYESLSVQHDRMLNISSFFTHEVLPLVVQQIAIENKLKIQAPELFDDLTETTLPKWTGSTFPATDLTTYIHRLEYLLELHSQIQIGAKVEDQERPKRIFLSHGRSLDWMKVQNYLERDLKYSTLELAQEPNLGRTVLQKLSDETSRCSYAVIVMTGDDRVEDEIRARENVLHEIGFLQAKYGLRNVALLHEAGVNIPSNIHGLVYIQFVKDYIEGSFSGLARELKTWV